jgi:hypothetical protein
VFAVRLRIIQRHRIGTGIRILNELATLKARVWEVWRFVNAYALWKCWSRGVDIVLEKEAASKFDNTAAITIILMLILLSSQGKSVSWCHGIGASL